MKKISGLNKQKDGEKKVTEYPIDIKTFTREDSRSKKRKITLAAINISTSIKEGAYEQTMTRHYPLAKNKYTYV